MSSVNEYKCLNCGAALRFDPPSGRWACDYCFSEFTKEQLDAVYTEEGLEKDEIEKEQKAKKKHDHLMEKALVLLGIIDNTVILKHIQVMLKDYNVEGEDEKVQHSQFSGIQEEEMQALTFINQSMIKKEHIDIGIKNEDGAIEGLNNKFNSYEDLIDKIGDMNLLEVAYNGQTYTVDKGYFTVMGLVYMLQQGELKGIYFLNTPESLGKVEKPDDDDGKDDALDVYRCTSCGAELIADETTSATFCVYCKNPAIIKDRFKGKFRPKWVIPFRKTKEDAIGLYNEWIKKKLFAPKAFKDQEEIEKITGIYAPFWLFDCNAVGSLNGRGTRVHTYRRGNYEYTNTKFYSVARAGSSRYEKIPIDSSKKLDDELMYMIEPYNYGEIKDFSMQYMTGFMAEKYDVEMTEAKTVMGGRAEAFLEGRLRDTIVHYASFHKTSSNINLLGVENNYALMPIYLLVTKYNDKEHKFIVNGQTGKVVGDTPISFGEQLKFGLILFTGLLILGVFGGALFG